MSEATAPMKVIDAIYQRRSVRSYSAQKLEPATIQALLKAAVWAPTAVHEEPWAFAIVQDSAYLKRLSDRAKPLFIEEVHRAHLDRGGHALEIFAQPDFNIFYNANTLIVICGKPRGPFVVADCWLGAENLMLAAHAMGLGTCVIGSAVPALNTPESKAELNIPSECTAIAPIIVGVPTGPAPTSHRKEAEVLCWI